LDLIDLKLPNGNGDFGPLFTSIRGWVNEFNLWQPGRLLIWSRSGLLRRRGEDLRRTLKLP
jgi:hypothetical protein